jgi:hypothetical protein
MPTAELIRITISRRTGEELAREVHEVPAASSRPWLDAVADILYSRAVRDGVIPSAVPAAEGGRERAG